MSFQFLVLLSTFRLIFAFQNNVCKNFEAYNNPYNNENCYYDPDLQLEPPAIIEKYAGTVEIHPVTTGDGYILNLFRIPNPDPKGIILIHHSIATSSRIYLWEGNNSIAMTLWRNGFDVWLANQRGTLYSDKHVKMTSNDYKYWDFSFHEIGFYDVSVELELIKQKTNGSKIIFLGHSLGSTAGLVYASMKSAESEDYLKVMVLLATPCYFNHVSSSVATLLPPFTSALEAFTNKFRIGSPLLLLPLIVPFSRVLLRTFPIIMPIVAMLVSLICGDTPQETDAAFFNYDSAVYADNFSWKILIHYLQIASVSRFQTYDYGKERNLKMYGSGSPPVYPLGRITVPTLLVSSFNDTLTDIRDSETLFQELHPDAKIYGHWKLTGLNHFDYLAGVHSREIFTNDLLKFLYNL